MRRSCSLSDLSPSSMLVPSNSQKKHGGECQMVVNSNFDLSMFNFCIKFADKYSPYRNQDSGLHSSTPFSSPISRSSSEIALMVIAT